MRAHSSQCAKCLSDSQIEIAPPASRTHTGALSEGRPHGYLRLRKTYRHAFATAAECFMSHHKYPPSMSAPSPQYLPPVFETRRPRTRAHLPPNQMGILEGPKWSQPSVPLLQRQQSASCLVGRSLHQPWDLVPNIIFGAHQDQHPQVVYYLKRVPKQT